MSCERLVNGVVNNLVNKMVETAWAGRPDVHTGSLAYRLEAFENCDVLSVVARVWFGPPKGVVVVSQRSSDTSRRPALRVVAAHRDVRSLVYRI
jgi:hypothetical protein